MTDDELIAELDKSGVWLIQHGPPVAFAGVIGTLRDALVKAVTLKDSAVGPIKIADGSIIISPDQILRLWKHLNVV
jgi:hypothetical protein